MARTFLNSSLKGLKPEDLPTAVETIFQQLEDQLNAQTNIAGLADANQSLPQGIARGDVVFQLQNGELKAGIYNGKEVIYASFGTIDGSITDEQHGNRSGGALHSNATPSVAGFESPADKAKLDRYKGDTSSGAPASLTEYPNDGDYGFHTDTVGITYSLAKNKSGTIYLVPLT